MSSPDWKEVSFDPSVYPIHGFAFTIANDLKEILNDKSQSVELRSASCKAMSLLEYEHAEVFLVKALRDQEDAVKEAALEGLVNLKKPIEKDCFEVLNNFTNKEITNHIILNKVQDAIKRGLIKEKI